MLANGENCSVMRLRTTILLSTILIAAISASTAQVARKRCDNGGSVELRVSYEGWSKTFLSYSLSKPSLFLAAWVEVWDGHTLLFRKRVPVQSTGEIVWAEPDDIADTPFELLISLAGATGSDDGGSALIGGIRDAGGTGPEFVNGQSFRFVEGAGTSDLSLRGNVLNPITSLLLLEQESPDTWLSREYLNGTMTDLHHMKVIIPGGYLARPTTLKLEPMPSDLFGIGVEIVPDFRSVTINVVSVDQFEEAGRELGTPVSANTPVSSITSVSPYPVPLMESDDPPTMELKVFGENLREDQQVLLNNGETIVTLKGNYISSQEIRVQIPRELWQRHRLSEKLVARTATGLCSSQVWESE